MILCVLGWLFLSALDSHPTSKVNLRYAMYRHSYQLLLYFLLTDTYIGVNSDPHFLVKTLSGEWLCYTLKGMEGEVYNLLSDIEYSINGLLIGTVFKGSEQTYFGSISVYHQSCETGAVTKFLITADNGLAVIGRSPYTCTLLIVILLIIR